MRVVSLVPSATETLLAWGVELAGVTRFCEQGDRYPTFGGTKDPKLSDIVDVSPDVVVMCDQENRREDAEALEAAGLVVHAIRITHLRHVGPEMIRLTETLGLQSSLGAACSVPVERYVPTELVRVFVPIWRKPWMTINNDTYAGSVLQAAGFTNIFSAHIDRYPSMEVDEILAGQPQRVLAPSEPYPFTERQRGELETFAPTHYVDGKDLFWWGARTPGAFERLQLLRGLT